MPGEGAPTKCTPEIQEIMLESVSMGLPIRFACDRAGISHTAHYEWLQKAEEGLQPYADYAYAMKKAKADAVLVRLSRIDAAAEAGAWQADMTYLERVYPEEFGRREAHSVAIGQDPDLGPVQTVSALAVLSDPQACELANALIARLSGGDEQIPDETSGPDANAEG
jgi:transposase